MGKMITRKEHELEKYSINIENLAKQILKDMGIKLHCLGFEYWIKAMLITVKIEIEKKPKLKMMELYYKVAKECNTTTTKVERAMRYAYVGLDLNNYFDVTYKINNTALLFLLKEEILSKVSSLQ